MEQLQFVGVSNAGVYDFSDLSDTVILDGICKLETAAGKGYGMPVALAALEAEADKRGLRNTDNWLDIPTEDDLVYLDEQASIMAQQYGATMEAKDVDIVWSEAVTFVSNVEEMPNKQYRLVMFLAGHDVEGPWSEYQAAVFKVECLRLARAGVGFSVEFK